ncbi:MAG: hypothetical protein ACPW60_13220 [Methylohalobius sp. ZOD2]|uniref:hypothetical protein n=1 Tax=Methylohalobius crimeensis TaxID=244365 RepID=UPI0003B79D4F|nr:hypothetical protein [Methylohalobius crimeensis]
MNLDTQLLTLTCPHCNNKFKEKIGRLKHNPVLACPACRQSLRIKPDNLRQGMEAVQKRLDRGKPNLRKLR